MSREQEDIELDEIWDFWHSLGYSNFWFKRGIFRTYLQKLGKEKVLHAIEIMNDKYLILDKEKYYAHEGAFRYTCGILRAWLWEEQGDEKCQRNR